MAPFSLPAPAIIPLRLPVFGAPKSIDTNTKIQLFCETQLDHQIFYTLDGTKPQPYAGIVQGSKMIKYSSPFCLPPGKVTIKAISVNANIHSMCSSVVTKRFEVLKVECESNNRQSSKTKPLKKSHPKNKQENIESKKNPIKEIDTYNEDDITVHGLQTISAKNDEDILDCFDEAFIGGSEFDSENSDLDDSVEDESSFPVNNGTSDSNGNNVADKNIVEETEDVRICDVTCKSIEDTLSETIEELVTHEENMRVPDVTNDTAVSTDTQFCCLKCDLTLQQCISCNKMNAVSSKFCIGCGKQLSRVCGFCKEYNSGLATFCQYCGKKLNTKNIKSDTLLKVDHSVMVKPASQNAGIQELPVMIDKCIQTCTDKNVGKKINPPLKRMPHHSPGRGYWHQQLDYICNHLKSHAYNNIEFRKEISEPMLSDFKSAHISKGENSVTVTVVFTPLLIEKYGFHVSDGAKPKDEPLEA